MKKKFLIPVFFLVVLIIAVVYFKVYNKPHPDYESEKPAYSLTADELYNALANEGGEQYINQVVEVKGVLEEFSVAQDGSYTLVLSAEEAVLGGVNARLSTDYKAGEVQGKLSEGENITLKCRCLGFDQDVISEVKLDNCFIIGQ